VLLPMTQSLYVPGTLASKDKILVDIGTNYYVEVGHWAISTHRIGACMQADLKPGSLLLCRQMTTEQGQEYCRRKVDKLRKTTEGLQQVHAWDILPTRWLQPEWHCHSGPQPVPMVPSAARSQVALCES
jgi:hypothetical protein